MPENKLSVCGVIAVAAAVLLAPCAYAQSADGWARALSKDPAYADEQQKARTAIQQYEAQQRTGQDATDADLAQGMRQYMTQEQRDQIVNSLETTYATKLGNPSFKVSSAYYVFTGGSYVICGSASYVKDGTRYNGSYIFNPQPDGMKAINVTYAMAQKEGCFGSHTVQLR